MTPLERAKLSLEGLSVGDAFGQQFFDHPPHNIESRTLPNPPWYYTDDTEMTLSIFENLEQYGAVEQDALARAFAMRYDPSRGYGPAMHRLLRQIDFGTDWRVAARESFEGQGSYGNGAAMRVAPIGAYFAHDLERVAVEAEKSAVVTHAHPEGVAGAVAVAIAAAQTWLCREKALKPSRTTFPDSVIRYLPSSEVKSKLERARNLPVSTSAELAALILGSGAQISAQDTVPFALWCAAGWLDHFEDALWNTVSGLGDRDTTCAIVGGIVVLFDSSALPQSWLEAREILPLF